MRSVELQQRVSALTPKMHAEGYVHDPAKWQAFIDAAQEAEDWDDLAPEWQQFVEEIEGLKVPRGFNPTDGVEANEYRADFRQGQIERDAIEGERVAREQGTE